MASTSLILLLVLSGLALDFAVGQLCRNNLTTFVLESFDCFTDRHLKCTGDCTCTAEGQVNLTSYDKKSWGRLMYSPGIRLMDPATSRVASFSTNFTFSMKGGDYSKPGEGMAFVMQGNPEFQGHSGGFLGLYNSNGKAGTPTVAVEFDTYRDWFYGFFRYNDMNSNHVGLDLDSINSKVQVDAGMWGIELAKERTVTAWIDYVPATEDSDGNLQVRISTDTTRPLLAILSYDIDLSKHISDMMYIGFSATTGDRDVSYHNILNWSFESWGLVPPPRPPAPLQPPPPILPPPPSVLPPIPLPPDPPAPLPPPPPSPSPPTLTPSPPPSEFSPPAPAPYSSASPSPSPSESPTALPPPPSSSPSLPAPYPVIPPVTAPSTVPNSTAPVPPPPAPIPSISDVPAPSPSLSPSYPPANEPSLAPESTPTPSPAPSPSSSVSPPAPAPSPYSDVSPPAPASTPTPSAAPTPSPSSYVPPPSPDSPSLPPAPDSHSDPVPSPGQSPVEAPSSASPPGDSPPSEFPPMYPPADPPSSSGSPTLAPGPSPSLTPGQEPSPTPAPSSRPAPARPPTPLPGQADATRPMSASIAGFALLFAAYVIVVWKKVQSELREDRHSHGEDGLFRDQTMVL